MASRIPGWNNIVATMLPLSSLGDGQELGEVLDTMDARIDSLASIFAAHNGLAYDHANSSGLTFAYKAGNIDDGSGSPVAVPAGTIALTANETNYIMVAPDGTISKSTVGFEAGKRPLAIVEAGAASFSMGDVTDSRAIIFNPAEGEIQKETLDADVQGRVPTVGFTIGAESGNARDITIQLKDVSGNNLSAVRAIEIWLADSTTGWELTTAPNGGVSIQTGTAMDVPTAGKRLRMMTDASGVAVIRITESGTKNLYVRVLLEGHAIETSTVVAFT